MALVLDALAAIEQVLKVVGAKEPAAALQVIRAILDALDEARHGKVTSEYARSQFRRLLDGLAAHDLAADGAMSAKFDDGGD